MSVTNIHSVSELTVVRDLRAMMHGRVVLRGDDARRHVWRFMTNTFLMGNRQHEDPAVFQARFSRCHRLLHLIACRVLGGPEQADDAIKNCWRTASRLPPRFEYEGAFRSWLLRVLIDEALAILRGNQQMPQPKVSPQPGPAEVLRKDGMSNAESNLPKDHKDQVSERLSAGLE